MVADIGELIFRSILGMSQYPGAPFTGNIYRDLIMFLLVPSIFIILIIYTMTGRVIADAKMRMMLGIGAYLFTIAGGYYSAFALLAGPYFIFLIFIVGLVYFVFGSLFGHHGGGGGGGQPEGQFPYHSGNHSSDTYAKKVGMFDQRRRTVILKDIRDQENIIKRAQSKLKSLPSTADRAIQAENDRISKAEERIDHLRRMLDNDFLDR